MTNKELFTIGEASRRLGLSIDTLRRWDKKGILPSFRPSPGGNRYYRARDLDRFLGHEDLLVQARLWVINQPVIPQPEFYCETRDIFQARLERMEIALKSIAPSESLAYLITAVAGEIGNNSFDHNLGSWPDIPGVYFRYDSDKKQIVLADRGQGILKTLRQVRPGLKTDRQALQTAFTEILSGRAPESRGNGLKFVREIIISNPLHLIFHSGIAFVDLKQNDTKFRAVKFHKSFRGCVASIYF